MTDANDCPECNGFGLIAVEGAPHAWTRAAADDLVDARPRKRCGRCGATAAGRPVPVPVVLRARLIVVDQWGDEAVDTAPSCATCRWADQSSGNIACDRVFDAGALAFLVNPEDAPVKLHVAPDFGCVQWEAK